MHLSKAITPSINMAAFTILSQQEAIFVGEGAALPSRVRVRNLKEDQLLKSNTIPFKRYTSKVSV